MCVLYSRGRQHEVGRGAVLDVRGLQFRQVLDGPLEGARRALRLDEEDSVMRTKL